MLAYTVYIAFVSLLAPAGALLLALRTRHRPLLRRFHPPVPALPARPLWLHACSVGEVNLARPIINAALKHWPEIPILLTVSTISGREMATQTCKDATIAWLPFDHPMCLRPFIRKAKPRALLLLETELWPALIHCAHRASVPIMLVNGRISDKHLPRYRRMRWILRPALRQLKAAAMQNDQYAQRLMDLGADADVTSVCGNTKFDGVAMSRDAARLALLRRQCGLGDDPILLFGSTRPGDEALAAQCWEQLRKEFPSLRLVIVPRHLNRLDEAMGVFTGPIDRRSVPAPSGARVFFVDTVGELVDFYALATIAVVGGSFYPGVNGHNPLEPAALGVPTVFGPYMDNFPEPAAVLIAGGAAIQVSAEQLPETLRRLLNDSHAREAMAAAGPQICRKNQGAIKKTLDIVERLLQEPDFRA